MNKELDELSLNLSNECQSAAKLTSSPTISPYDVEFVELNHSCRIDIAWAWLNYTRCKETKLNDPLPDLLEDWEDYSLIIQLICNEGDDLDLRNVFGEKILAAYEDNIEEEFDERIKESEWECWHELC